MAVLTLQITGLNARSSKNISGALATRLLAAFRSIYGKKPDPANPGQQIDRTDQELFDFVSDVYFARMKEDARNAEGYAADKAVAPIDL